MPKAIEFNQTGQAARINYQLPLPGSHTGRRIIELDLGLTKSDFTSLANTVGDSIADSVGAQPAGKDKYAFDKTKAERLYFKKSKELASKVPYRVREAILNSDRALISTEKSDGGVGSNRLLSVASFETNIAEGLVMVPVPTWAGGISHEPVPIDNPVRPRVFLIELYGISSFLGDYGMGKTVKTFTLLPGETTNISLRTWQTTKESRQESSSIIDSHEQSAKERFADKIQNETTDKQTKSKTEEWHVEAEAKASWGWGSAKVSGGGSGQYSSGREQFARQASESVQEHASEASSKREMSVSSSSERTEETGQESIIERTISNVNMRRVLNFVFRELNQEYITKLHLKDIKVAFTNGKLNSWREVSIAELYDFLEDFIVTSKREEVAQTILKLAGYVKDKDDTIVRTLEKVTLQNHDTSMTVVPGVVNDSGKFAMPGPDTYYRFKKGPLNQDNATHPVEGVLQSTSNITMRTDSVIVEALLGQADALDEFAMEIQKAAAEKEILSNKKETMVQEIIASLPNSEKKIEALINLEHGCCEKGEDTQ